jgi:hypothetical protein
VKRWAASGPALDELRLLLDELCASFGEQRRAIAQLSGAKVSWLVTQQTQICARIESLLATSGSRERLPEILAAVRREAEATAMLATVAAHNVRNVLEQRELSGYSASARPTRSTVPICLLTTL